MNGLQANECPSHFALDDDALHSGGGGTAGHVEGCSRCQGRQAERTAAAELFHDTIAGPLGTRVAALGAERRQRRRRLAFVRLPALIGALGALGALVVVGRPTGYVGTKGVAPIVDIFCRRAGVVSLLAPGSHIEPGDDLRFRAARPVRPDARFIQIGSVDGTGRYTPFYPSAAGAQSVALPANGQMLDGAIRIDDAPGPERLFVVVSTTPLSEAAVRRVAEPGAAQRTTVDRIDAVPVTTAWIALEKRAGRASPP